ncbi:hypothetical protein ACFFV7_50920 [Nonomuraea spiralis]|uniref:Uncharacterized protein n=1 Tax=Nonomuraea spiralis TaxID=46182 RepID=A0ABV5IYD2_9ACTN|nr:hypothetical protein [Nonomuraea spiralis]GGS88561.1 hypothetical protein GCM10010176_035420 [Nonomuraea spiralis]
MPTYTVETNGDIALTAATAKTVLNVINSGRTLKVTELSVSFDGVTANAEPVTVELCASTQATAGTPGATPTPAQVSGAARSAVATAGRAYSAEPTVLTVLKRWLIHPAGGALLMQYPLGREPLRDSSGHGLALRCTAPAAVNCQGYIEIAENE